VAGTKIGRADIASTALTDWPTLAAIAAFWVSLASVILWWRDLPTFMTVVVLALLGCFYMSLQHEVIHGHPTRWRRVNWLLVAAPLGLLLPFERYRAHHAAHHRSELTDPLDDPESFYVSSAAWQRAGTVRRAVLIANRSMAFRLFVWPLIAAPRTAIAELRLARRDRDIAIAWAMHVVGALGVVVVVRQLGMPLWIYALGFVYGGSSLTMLRSFVEHFAAAEGPRSAVVRSNWFFGLLFLNNNLHYAHHQLPGAAWFRLPELSRTLDAEAVVADSAGAYRGYLQIARRHFLRPFHQPVNPLSTPVRL